MDVLQYQVRLAQEEAQKYRKQHAQLLERYMQMAKENELQKIEIEKLDEIIKDLEKKLRLSNGIDIKEIAKTPLLFDQVIEKMSRPTVFKMMRTNHSMKNAVMGMTKKKTNPLNPMANVTVKIERAMWEFGFNSIHFECYLARAAAKQRLDTVAYKRKDSDKRIFMSKNGFKMSIRGFKPKEFLFNFGQVSHGAVQVNNKFFDQHESFLKELKPALGTKTSIHYGMQDLNLKIIDILKPKTLTLFRPRVLDFSEMFKDEKFKCVENLRISEYNDIGLAMDYHLDFTSLTNQLVTFEFDGKLSTFPSEQVNSMIRAWVSGESKLRKTTIVIDKIDFEPVVTLVLQELPATSVKFFQIPGPIQKMIKEDLAGNDVDTSAFSYRLLASPAKRQMGCLYFCSSVKTPFTHAEKHSHFGFAVIDFYPEK